MRQMNCSIMSIMVVCGYINLLEIGEYLPDFPFMSIALRFLASIIPSVRLFVIGLYDNDVNKWPHLSFKGAVRSFQNTGFAVKSTCNPHHNIILHSLFKLN